MDFLRSTRAVSDGPAGAWQVHRGSAGHGGGATTVVVGGGDRAQLSQMLGAERCQPVGEKTTGWKLG